MNKNILYLVVIIILIVIFVIAGNNIMNLNYKVLKNAENITYLNQKLNDDEIILKNLTNNNIVEGNLNKGVGIITDPEWEQKVKNHMNYPHGNPLMYNKPDRELYNDLK